MSKTHVLTRAGPPATLCGRGGKSIWLRKAQSSDYQNEQHGAGRPMGLLTAASYLYRIAVKGERITCQVCRKALQPLSKRRQRPSSTVPSFPSPLIGTAASRRG